MNIISQKEKRQLKTDVIGYTFILPILINFFVFILYPLLISFYYSFTDYNVFDPIKFIRMDNYIRAFTLDWKVFSKSLSVTGIYSIIMIPVTLVLSFLLALLLSKKFKGVYAFRVIMYIPILLPSVVTGLLWRNVTNVKYGLGNEILGWFGLNSSFFNKAQSSLPTFMFINLFGLGANMILWIASFKNIPNTFYEAADIEGASEFVKTTKITIPMCSSFILYILITSFIGCFQTFSNVYVLACGTAGVQNSLLFYVMNVFQVAFKEGSIGYASALSWLLFLVIGLLTMLVFKTSKWVFYGDEG